MATKRTTRPMTIRATGPSSSPICSRPWPKHGRLTLVLQLHPWEFRSSAARLTSRSSAWPNVFAMLELDISTRARTEFRHSISSRESYRGTVEGGFKIYFVVSRQQSPDQSPRTIRSQQPIWSLLNPSRRSKPQLNGCSTEWTRSPKTPSLERHHTWSSSG